MTITQISFRTQHPLATTTVDAPVMSASTTQHKLVNIALLRQRRPVITRTPQSPFGRPSNHPHPQSGALPDTPILPSITKGSLYPARRCSCITTSLASFLNVMSFALFFSAVSFFLQAVIQHQHRWRQRPWILDAERRGGRLVLVMAERGDNEGGDVHRFPTLILLSSTKMNAVVGGRREPYFLSSCVQPSFTSKTRSSSSARSDAISTPLATPRGSDAEQRRGEECRPNLLGLPFLCAVSLKLLSGVSPRRSINRPEARTGR